MLSEGAPNRVAPTESRKHDPVRVQFMNGQAVELSGEVLAAVSREMVRIKAEHYGKGATEAKSSLGDNFLFCVLKDGITQVERNLLEHDDADLVRRVRLRFQDNMAETFTGAVARISGHEVLTYESQIMFDPDYTVEMFVLGVPTSSS